MNKSEIWTVAYSPEQKQFHLETLDKTLKRQVRNCLNNHHDQYFVIDMADSAEEGHELIAQYEATGKFPRAKV